MDAVLMPYSGVCPIPLAEIDPPPAASVAELERMDADRLRIELKMRDDLLVALHPALNALLRPRGETLRRTKAESAAPRRCLSWEGGSS